LTGIVGAISPLIIVLGEGRSAMARTLPPRGASAMNTLKIDPQAAVGDGKEIATEFDFIPADAAENWPRSFETATLSYEPPAGSETYPPLYDLASERPIYRVVGGVIAEPPKKQSRTLLLTKSVKKPGMDEGPLQGRAAVTLAWLRTREACLDDDEAQVLVATIAHSARKPDPQAVGTAISESTLLSGLTR
jgi:hypothetical protein